MPPLDADAPPHTARASDSRTFGRAFTDLRSGFANHQLWLHLGWQDIKQRYRRSLLGPLWITIATGITSVAMGVLYSKLFGTDIQTFLPHVVLGFIFWNFLQASILEGSDVFTKNDGLIKQLPTPLSVHVYRLVWRQLIIFLHNIPIYLVVFIVFPQPIGWSVLLVIPALALFLLNGVWISMIFGILACRFRDIAPLLATAVQLMFFMTPVIWDEKLLRTGAEHLKWVQINPAYHYIEIARSPLQGQPVAAYHWFIVIGCVAVGWALALLVLRNYRARVPYWV